MESILIVDDEKLFRETMADTLSKIGYKIFTAKNGQEALSIVKNNEIQVILLDIILPGLDGRDVLLAIKKFKPDVPVIMVTGHASLESAIESLKGGAYDYLSKPFKRDELIHVVQMAIDKYWSEFDRKRSLRYAQQLGENVQDLATVGKETPLSFMEKSDLVLQKIVDLIAEIIEVEIVSLMLVDEDQNLFIKAARGLSKKIKSETKKKVGEGIAGWVAEKGKPLFIKDVMKDFRFQEARFFDQYKTKSLISVPLKIKGEVIGVLSTNNKISGRSFTEHDFALINTFSNQATLVLENAGLYSDMSWMLEELSALNEMARGLSSSLDPKVILNFIMKKTKEMMQVEACSLILIDKNLNKLVFEIVLGNKGEEVKKCTLDIGKGIAGWVAKEGKPLLINDVTKDDRFSEEVDKYTGFTTKSILCVPLAIRGRILGVIEVINKLDKTDFTEKDSDLLQHISAHASISLNNAELYEKLNHSVQEIIQSNKDLQKANLQLSNKINELHGLRKTSKTLSSATDLGEVLKIILETVTKVFSFSKGIVLLVDIDEEEEVLRQGSCIGEISEKKVKQIELSLTQHGTASIKAVLEGKALNIPDTKDCTLIEEDSFEKEFFQSLAVVPMIVNNQVIGVILVSKDEKQEQISEDEVESLLSFAYQAAAVIQSIRLMEMNK